MSSHLERRLAVQLAGKTTDELIAMIARQQIRYELDKGKIATPSKCLESEVELLNQIGLAYFGPEDMRGLTLPMMARNMESDALALGYPVRQYLKRFTNSGQRRRQS